MYDYYQSFDHLFSDERMEVDYDICVSARRCLVLIMAPHGGAIEPGTSQVARQIAGDDYSLFLFEGKKTSGNWQLHIRSDNYELPQALTMAHKADWLITIHGCKNEDQVTLVGGRDTQLKRRISEELTINGFHVNTSSGISLGGMSSKNICNRNRRNVGVQMELSNGQRRQMFKDCRGKRRTEATEVFYSFCESIRSALMTTLHGTSQTFISD